MLGKKRFPWRDGHDVALLCNGEEFFPAMLTAIDEAETCVLFELYLVSSSKITTRFINALLQAADRGVDVFLLWDDFGCFRLKQNDRDRLNHPNIYLRFYNPLQFGRLREYLFRDHRKLLVIDKKIAFVGGLGLTQEFSSSDSNRSWRETVLQIKGPCLNDWHRLFTETWGVQHPKFAQYVMLAWYVSHNGETARISCSQSHGQHEIKRNFLQSIRRAEQEIWVATAYFLPSLKIRRELRKAALRGVVVRILVPGKQSDHPAVSYAGRRFYPRLLRAGIDIYEYQPTFSHSKILVCDDWVSIGSSNMDRWNFRWNLEANQEISSTTFSRQVKNTLQRDLEQSKRILLSEWHKRSWLSRMKEYFWSRIDTWVDRWLQK